MKFSLYTIGLFTLIISYGLKLKETSLSIFQREVTTEQQYTHLKDTVKIKGKSILILRPDSLRFQSYLDSGKESIYEVDSDFGFGVSRALDSINIEGVRESVTEKRYIKIEDCLKCPLIVDRDTIDYGFILTEPNRAIVIDQNVYGAEYYIQKFENYFEK